MWPPSRPRSWLNSWTAVRRFAGSANGTKPGWAFGRGTWPGFGSMPPAESQTILPNTVAAFHRLPTWTELAVLPEAELRACLLGFRARYIADTARFLAARPGWLEETETLPYSTAKERLRSLPGVGEKI